MLYAAIAVIVVVIIIGFVYNYKRRKAINEGGFEVDAPLSRIREVGDGQ